MTEKMAESKKKSDTQELKKLLRQPLEFSLALILVLIVLVTFTQVLFRYVFHLSLAWSEELARYLFLWLASLTAAYAFKTRSHFALRFLVNALNKKFQKIVQTLVVFIISAFLLVFIWKAIEFTIRMSKKVSPSLQMSMAVPYASVIVGGGLMLYYVLRNWVLDIREEKKDREIKTVR
jgi:TRAP-type C4-dicarboxylate transport system permease small subunit